ncbi:hypothetical protein B7486_17545 [cyanobacterium TDX16]|nr:hypothetical protein B7486_17545 [cyanobacterium TDX16]
MESHPRAKNCQANRILRSFSGDADRQSRLLRHPNGGFSERLVPVTVFISAGSDQLGLVVLWVSRQEQRAGEIRISSNYSNPVCPDEVARSTAR